MLKSRTLDTMSAYSIDEQKHLYHKTKLLKQAYENGDTSTLELFKISDKNMGIYEVFLEDSTRTKESFRNAIEFHGVQGKIFDTSSSSFNKQESYADTFNMLAGYDNQIFIVRSKLEGVCTRLDRNAAQYATRHGLAKQPLYINAGDGKHEHPTQEFLDQFTFLEHNNRDSSHIHIALIGDLLYGRTIHSKVEGLRIYDKVQVDLIAPELLSLPDSYLNKMYEYGYKVRIFSSVDDYLKQSQRAPIRYWTRVQIERMGEDIIKQEYKIRQAITCRQDHVDQLDLSKTKFYHPLPRHKITPVIPTRLDDTSLNGWETQSRNGMFVRIVLLAVTAGVPHVVNDFQGKGIKPITYNYNDWVKVIEKTSQKERHYSEGVHPITNGIVIDHIGKGWTIQQIKQHMTKIVSILGLYTPGGEWISKSGEGHKGIIFRPDYDISDTQVHQLGALAPGCTLNHVTNQQISKKVRLSMPPRLYNLEGLACKNIHCISHSDHHEHIISEFIKKGDTNFECIYCGQQYLYHEVRAS